MTWYSMQQQQQQQRQQRQQQRQREAPAAAVTTTRTRRPPLHPSSSNSSIDSAASASTSSSLSSSPSLRRRSSSSSSSNTRRGPLRSAFRRSKYNKHDDSSNPPALISPVDSDRNGSMIKKAWNNTRSHNNNRRSFKAMEAGQLPSDNDFSKPVVDQAHEERELLKKKQARKKQKRAWQERSMRKKRIRNVQNRNKANEAAAAATTKAEAGEVSGGSDKENGNSNGLYNIDESTEEGEVLNQQEEESAKAKKKKNNYEVDIMQLAPDEEPPDPSCCRRYLSERNPCYDWYKVKDILIGKRMDAAATFCPQSRKDRLLKMISTTTVLAATVMNILDYRDQYGTIDMGYMCYLDNLGMLGANFYMLLSLLNSILGAVQPWEVIEGRLRWTWLWFIMASHTNVMMTVMYWSLVYGGPGNTKLDFLTIMKYGGVAVQVVWDGLSVNRIPLRWMSWWGCLWGMNLMYFFAFAPMYSFFFSSNLAIPGASTALYPFLDWKGDWEYTIVVSVIFCFALSPAVFLGLWCMSLYQWPLCFCCRKESRRYILSRSQQRKLKEKKMEAYRKKKEAKAAKEAEEALAMLEKKDPTSRDGLLMINKEDSTRSALSRIYGNTRRLRQAAAAMTRSSNTADDSTIGTYFKDDSSEFQSEGSVGEAQQQQKEQRRRKLKERKQLEELHPRYAESMVYNGQLQVQEQQQQQQQEQETKGGGGWGADLRSFLGHHVSGGKNTNQSGNSTISSVSFSSGDSASHSYRGREEFNDDEEAQYSYPWDNSSESESGGFKDVGVVLGNDDYDDGDQGGLGRFDNSSDTRRDSEYKYPWDRDASEGSLTFL